MICAPVVVVKSLNSATESKGMNTELPDIIKEVGFDFSWSNEKVWRLNIPVTEMNINELVWHFDIPFHWYSGDIYNLTSRQIIDNPDKYSDEYQRTMKADLSYPIDIMENKGRWLILDGLHRLMKAYIQGAQSVRVRIIPREMIALILSDEKLS